MTNPNAVPVRCQQCGFRTMRIKHDDGTYGICTRCIGGELRREDRAGDLRVAKAKQDLAGGPSK